MPERVTGAILVSDKSFLHAPSAASFWRSSSLSCTAEKTKERAVQSLFHPVQHGMGSALQIVPITVATALTGKRGHRSAIKNRLLGTIGGGRFGCVLCCWLIIPACHDWAWLGGCAIHFP